MNDQPLKKTLNGAKGYIENPEIQLLRRLLKEGKSKPLPPGKLAGYVTLIPLLIRENVYEKAHEACPLFLLPLMINGGG
jgi:hypothetical protein